MGLEKIAITSAGKSPKYITQINHHTTVQNTDVQKQKCKNMQISVMLGGRVVNHPI